MSILATAIPSLMAAGPAGDTVKLSCPPSMMAPSKRVVDPPPREKKSDDEQRSGHDDDHDDDEESMVVAARVLQEFRDFPRPPKSPSEGEPVMPISRPQKAGGIRLIRSSSTTSKWASTRTRSRVLRRARSTSLDATILNSAAPEVHRPLAVSEAFKVEALKADASPGPALPVQAGGDSKVGQNFVLEVEKVAAVQCNGGSISSISSLSVEAVEMWQQKNSGGAEQDLEAVEEKVDLQVVDMESLNEERLHKLVSDSSNEFPSRGSPNQRPSSPLAVMSHPAETNLISGWAAFDAAPGGLPPGRSVFQKAVVPIRPLKKPTGPRKLKVEDKSFESASTGQAELVKATSRKKPKSTAGCVESRHHHQLQLQLQLQLRQPLAPTKSEELDPAFESDIAAEDRTYASEKGKALAWVETANTVAAVPVPLLIPSVALGDDKYLNVAASNAAAGSTGRPGYRGVGKPKIELNEDEQEARRLRRAQANRESARQTIRRKQHLTEERSKAAQTLAKDNETLRKEVERVRIERDNLRQLNAHLTDQVAKLGAGSKTDRTSPSSPKLEKEVPVPNIHFPFSPLEGVAYNPAYMYAVMGRPGEASAAGAGAGAEIPYTEMSVGPGSFAPVLGLPGGTIPAAYLSVASPSSGATTPPTFLPSFIPGAVPPGVPLSSPAAGTRMMGHTPLERSISLPVPQDSKYSLLPTGRGLVAASPLVSHRSGDFGHFSSHSRRTAGKGDVSYSGSGFNLKSMNTAPPRQQGNELRGAVSLPARKHGDKEMSFLTPHGSHFSRSHSGAALDRLNGPFAGYPLPGGATSSEAQKAAAEARRLRKEKFRSKQKSSASSTPAS